MILYDVFFFVFSLIYLPYLVIKGKAHRRFAERFGRLPRVFKEINASRPIWIHAVSVGEVFAVKNFAERLSAKFPERKIVLSTTTRTGNDVARSVLSENILKFYFPLDFSFVVRRAVGLINPSIVIIMETEIWPNFILELSKRKVPIALLNGRISDRSFKGYRKIRFFFKDILGRIDIFCMRGSKDAERMEELGGRKERLRITGNMKFDIETGNNRVGCHSATYAVSKPDLGVEESDELLIAGSTHGKEEEIVLDAYSKLLREFKHLRLLIAPRHIDRARAIKKMAGQKGIEAVLLSEIEKKSRKNPVLILDTFGKLGRLYRLATIVFMGGSLVRRGGHNIVEPAVFAKPIVFGPHMFNFRDMANSFLEEDAAQEVKNEKGLEETLKALLTDRERRNILGRNAKGLINRNKGATERNINELATFIGEHR